MAMWVFAATGGLSTIIILDFFEKGSIVPFIIGGIIGLVFGLNQYTIIDTSKNILSSPMFYIFRKSIKLSEIESYDQSVDTQVSDKGHVTETYILTLYGSFGSKKFNFTSKSVMRNVINNLKNLK